MLREVELTGCRRTRVDVVGRRDEFDNAELKLPPPLRIDAVDVVKEAGNADLAGGNAKEDPTTLVPVREGRC